MINWIDYINVWNKCTTEDLYDCYEIAICDYNVETHKPDWAKLKWHNEWFANTITNMNHDFYYYSHCIENWFATDV